MRSKKKLYVIRRKNINQTTGAAHKPPRNDKKGGYIMKVLVKVYDGSKYDAASTKIVETRYSDVVSLEIKTISDDEILKVFDNVDECGEYAILTYADGTTSTFRNSHVDVFYEHPIIDTMVSLNKV